MGWRRGLLVLVAALLAGGLGVAASVAVNGPGLLLQSAPGQWLLQASMDQPQPSGVSVVAIGERVPVFGFTDLSGRPRTLPAPGKAVLVNYWATWCGPCRRELPLLASLALQPDPPVRVVHVALDSPGEVRAFLAANPRLARDSLLEAPGSADSSVKLGNHQGALPFSVLIDAQGRLVKRRTGPFANPRDLGDWISAPAP